MSDTRSLPWSVLDVLLLWALLIVGGVALFLSWWGTSSTPRLGHQMVWLNVGALGLMVSGLGVVIWLTSGRRALGRYRHLVLGDAPPAPEMVADSTSDLVAGPAMTRYHRPECAFVGDKAVTGTTREAHHRAGRRPCGMCLGEER